MMDYKVFLGGTVGSNPWRTEIVIPALVARGIPESVLFNPVVEHWNDAAQRLEDEIKATASYLLFVIASPDPKGNTANISSYSLVELSMNLYDHPSRTVGCFLFDGLPKHTAKAMRKACQDLHQRFPDAPIFESYDEVIDWLAEKLVSSPGVA